MFNKKAELADLIGLQNLLNEHGFNRNKKQTRTKIYGHLP